MTQIFMITETLFVESQARCLCHINISDSALKVVLSYYPVCRCQRTSRFSDISSDKKTQSCADDRFRFRKSCRDKIESNLQSQMYVEQTPCIKESRVQRINKVAWAEKDVNSI